MFTVATELTVDSSDRGPFEESFAASMQATLPGVPGLQRAHLLRPRENERSYLAVLEFEDEDAYTAYTSSEAFHAAHRDPSHSFARAHRLTTYEPVAQTTG